MPPIQQQGSRTGLIVTMVISIVLLVTVTVLWFFENAEAKKVADELKDLRLKVAPAISDADYSTPEYTALTEVMNNPQSKPRGETIFQTQLAQNAELTRMIAGSKAPTSEALKAGQQAIARATGKDVKDAGTNLSTSSSLASLVTSLAARVVDLEKQNTQLTSDLQTSKQETQRTAASITQVLAERDTKINELSALYQKTHDELNQAREAAGTNVQAIEQSAQEQIKTIQETATKIASENKTLKGQLATLTDENAKLKGQLAHFRPKPNEPIIMSADGKIVRVPNENTAIIDIASGSGISKGMTFEVYSKYTGVPPLADGQREAELPIGKASIQILEVGPVSSTARIIRKTLGESLVEGDVISNLVYDPKSKYNFFIYGDFDLNQDGKASPEDAKILRERVTAWGGANQSEINVDTDFLVLGKEPTVKELSEEDKQDPIAVQQYDEAVKRLEAYHRVRDRALDLNIPIMNQNRFLYYTGYYREASR